MEVLPVIYLTYMFFSIYFISLFLLLYLENRKVMRDIPKAKKEYSISILVPAFNEEKTISNTIETIFSVDYPIEELIVLNDGSTDNTKKIIEKLLKKYLLIKFCLQK